MRRRIAGMLRGLAAGDRNGGPIRMALELGEALVEAGGFEPDRVFARYLAWWQDGGFDTGPVAESVFRLVTAGWPRDRAVRYVHDALDGQTAGCNPLHRVAPLAAAATVPGESLAEAAFAEAELTHFHPVARDGAAVVAVLCRTLLLGEAWERALEQALAAAQLPMTAAAVRGAREGPAGRGGYAPEALQSALHFVDGHEGLSDALEAAIEYAGPANYCSVLVGAIGGARWCTDDALLEHFPPTVPVERLERLATMLAAGWHAGSGDEA